MGEGAVKRERDQLLKVAEVRKILGLGESAARDLMKRLGAVRIGPSGMLRLSEKKLDKWIARGGDEWRTTPKASVSTEQDGAETVAPDEGAHAQQPRSTRKSLLTPIKPGTKPRTKQSSSL